MSSQISPTPAPAYEANPTQSPEKVSTPSAMQETAVYNPMTGQQQQQQQHQQHNGNMYPPQPISPLASPTQQPQGMVPEKQEYYNPGQQPQLHPQQQQQYPQQQQQYQQTYQTAVPLANLSEVAAPVDCPVCRHRALTVVEPRSGNTTHAWAALACIVFCLGCVPYLISGLKDVQHKCGHCGVVLAQWHKSGRTVVLQHA